MTDRIRPRLLAQHGARQQSVQTSSACHNCIRKPAQPLQGHTNWDVPNRTLHRDRHPPRPGGHEWRIFARLGQSHTDEMGNAWHTVIPSSHSPAIAGTGDCAGKAYSGERPPPINQREAYHRESIRRSLYPRHRPTAARWNSTRLRQSNSSVRASRQDDSGRQA